MKEFTTLKIAPSTPTLLSPANNQIDVIRNINFDWTSTSNTEYYRIQISTDSTFTNVTIDSSYIVNSEIIFTLNKSEKYFWQVQSVNNGGASAWTSIWNFTTAGSEPVPSSWAFTDFTGSNSTVLVPKNINPKIDDRDFQKGDAVGFFFTRNGALICAGYGVWNNVNMAVTVWGDDSETEIKDGFASNEGYTIKIWDGQLGKEMNSEFTVASGNAFYTTNGFTTLATLKGVSTTTQAIYLKTGWNLMSSYVIPTNDSLENIWRNLNNKLVIAKNNAGQVYIPSYDINTIGNMLPGQGYQMYISAKDTLIYPANSVGKLSFGKLTPNPKYLEAKYSSTGSSSNLIIITNANEGDEFGIYNQKDELIGSGIVHQGKVAITIWGDNDQTEEIDGAELNEELRLKHYNIKNGLLQEVDLQLNNQKGELIGSTLRYKNDGISFAKVDIKLITESLSLEINPNPATSSFEISYQFGNTNNCSIVIYNNNGFKIDEITNLTDNKYIYNSNKLSSGIYTVILNCDEQVLMRKLVIAK